MKRAIVPNPPDPNDQVYRAKPDLWQQALYRWMLQTKEVIETTNLALIGGSSSSNVTATDTPTPRSLDDRFADWINVKDYGAVLDGVTDDSAAFQAVINAAHAGQTIYVPYGGLLLNTTPTNSPGVVWKIDGTHYGTGATIVNEITPNDPVEWLTGYEGRKAIWKTVTDANAGYATSSSETIYSATNGSTGAVAHSFLAKTSVSNAAVNQYCWALQGEVDSSGTGAGQHVGVAAIANKLVANTTTGNGIWAAYAAAADHSGLPSSTSGGVVYGMEIDLSANDVDNTGTVSGVQWGTRVLLQLAPDKYNGTGATAQVAHGILIGNSNTAAAQIGSCFRVSGAYYNAAIDTRIASQGTGANAIWLNDGHTIALDKAGNHTLYYDPGTSKTKIAVSGTAVFSIDGSGNVIAKGTVTQNGTP